jgi:DNA-binding beta-propeller fold protein YncE
VKKAVLVAAALVAATAIAYVWQIVGATGPALPLRALGDFPLTGSASRFDYASMDPGRGVLWLAHMGDGAVEAFDIKTNRVTLTVLISPKASVRGILVARGKVYAAAQGLSAVAVLDATNGKRLATIPGGDVDGLAYDPTTQRVFVSDEGGGRDIVIDARADRAIGSVALGGEAGNTQYDDVSHHVFVGVQTRNELVEIDPAVLKVLRRYPLSGCGFAHSVAIDSAARAVYIGCQQNARLVRLDLRTGRVTASGGVGIGIDVLAFDPGLERLYAGSETGVVSVYDVTNAGLDRIAQAFLALHAHVVAVDIKTHRVYFPLQSVAGKPVMREMEPRFAPR